MGAFTRKHFFCGWRYPKAADNSQVLIIAFKDRDLP